MANEPTNDFSGAFSDLLNAAGKLAQQQVDMVSSGVQAAVSIVEPLTKTALELAGSAENTATQMLQNLTSAITPKK